MRLSIILALLTASFLSVAPAQNSRAGNPRQNVLRPNQNRPAQDFWVSPQKFRAVALDHAAMKSQLAGAPNESAHLPASLQSVITLAMPDGTDQKFRIVESPVMAPELAAKFPEIKTYVGQGIDDPSASVRLDLTPAGFHAQVLSPHGAVYIDPHLRDRSVYASYYKHDYRRAANEFECFTPAGQSVALNSAMPADLARSGGNLRTYRLAVSATGEYTQFQGGTLAAGMAAVVTAVNRVVGVYETEVAIRMVLVANEDLLIYTNGSTDPFSNNNATSLLSQNQSTIDSIIGSGNYDIGHVFSTAGGGLAVLGCVCSNTRKAQGETGLSAPTGDAFYIDYVAHEMGHQFGANHTFNSSTSSCGGGNRNASTAYEPGSGSTIMAYAGICGADDLQPHSDPYFHSISFDEILNYTTGGAGNGCAVITSTGNSAPTVSAGPSYTIPSDTPFVLAASGSDPNGDALTYCWEERDLGASITLTTPDNGSSPLFRSFNPTTSVSRTFPKLSDILNNATTLGEMLPTTSRTMSFRVTARDNRAGGGGVNTADTQVTVVSSAGPFAVTSHASGGTFSNSTLVTWNVAGTTASPINTANVDIYLSTDGGQTFPILLAANTSNDGAQTVTLPLLNSSSARIKVQGSGNIFFAVNAANFTIVPGIPTPQVVVDSAGLLVEGCAPGNGAIDPGETVTVNFTLKNIGTGNTTNLLVTLLTTNGVSDPSSAQSVGALAAGGGTIVLPFTFTASGSCGGTVTATFQLQDNAASLGTVSWAFPLGAVTTGTTSRTNATALTLPGSKSSGPASIYPSTILVSGVTGTVSKVTVTLDGLSHANPDDLDILLVGPNGQKTLLMSDAGGGNAISGVTLTFDDEAAAALPDNGQIVSGTYQPTDFDTASDSLSAPSPAGPYVISLTQFAGLDPNGTWSLYVDDDRNPNTGSLAQGWRLSFTTFSSVCCAGNVVVPRPVITNFTLTNGVAALTWSAVAGHVYRLQFKQDFTESNWTDIIPDLTATGTNIIATDTVGATPRKFYRVMLVQ